MIKSNGSKWIFLYKIYVIWCLWILGKQRLKGESVWWMWFLKLLPSTRQKIPNFTDNRFMLQSALGAQTLQQSPNKTLNIVSDSFSPHSRTNFFITVVLQTVLGAFCRCLCQCKSFFCSGRIPYSALKSCRAGLTSMAKIGVTCLPSPGQLEFIQKYIRTWKKE